MQVDRAELEIRVAGSREHAAIALLRSLWAGADDLAFEQRMSEWLAAEGARRTTWVAMLGEEPVGMASLFEYRRMPRPRQPDSRWGYVSNMFVREEFRNRGIGSLLLRAIIQAADERRYARLVLSPSERSARFYERAGFMTPDGAAGSDRLLVRPAAGLPHGCL
jgi:GNAT superfamily N-acetyltransferase